jgi:hypothetical protein
MRHKSFVLVTAAVAVLIAGAIAIYAYDSSRDDLIAEGVTIAGADVGGLTTAEARVLVRREVAKPLDQPVTVTRGRRRFTLTAQRAALRVDVGGMVDEALEQSRDGIILSRVARDITGGEEDAQIDPRVSYSSRAVGQFVDRMEKALNRRPQDAKLNFPSLTRVQERRGLKVEAAVLERRLRQALTVPGVDRTLRAPAEVIKPKVTRAELADRYPVLLVVERGSFTLKAYKRLRLRKSYRVAVGQVGFDTPAGLYHIQNKGVNVAWHVPRKPWAGSLAGRVIPGGAADNPIKARWMGIYDGAGIHGTDQVYSLGSAASHGCIRMAIPDVIELYDQVPVQTPIYIA